MARLFGTDGIRGVPGEAPLDDKTLFALGANYAATREGGRFLIGMDTRESGPDLSKAFAEGIASAGAEAVIGGVLPTPAVSLLIAEEGFRGGAVLSASHNPWRDNGIKILSRNGEKLSDAEEDRLQRCLENGEAPTGSGGRVVEDAERWRARYVEDLIGWGPDLSGLTVLLDCANGAMAGIAAEALSRVGAKVQGVMGGEPNGRNINEACGSLHTQPLAERVAGQSVDLGVAFDGDGDRAILVDANGAVRDGDDVLFACGTDRHAREELPNSTIVGTVMTNVGLESALAKKGIELLRAAVGDRYVLERMRACGSTLGGEPSGHVIFLDRAVTGDGLLTALETGSLMVRTGNSLADACDGWRRCPQVLLNVPVARRIPIQELPDLCDAETSASKKLEGRGRVLLRYSGTEPLLRVMVEGPDANEIEGLAETIADAARVTLGPPTP